KHMHTAERIVSRSSQTANRSRTARAESRAASVQPVGMSNQAMQRLLLAGAIQPKLTINRPGDEFEREADRVAKVVMGLPEPGTLGTIPVAGRAAQPRLQRVCSKCKPEVDRTTGARLQRMCSHCEEELHRKAGTSFEAETPAALETQIDALR